MKKEDWKDDLASYFEEYRILEESKVETLENFEHFAEFVAEPAFESVQEELKTYKVKSRIKKLKAKWISFQIYFPKSNVENFEYIIILPKNAVELSLVLVIKGRKMKKGMVQSEEKPFMAGLKGEKVLKLKKEDLIADVVEHYRNFNFSAFSR